MDVWRYVYIYICIYIYIYILYTYAYTHRMLDYIILYCAALYCILLYNTIFCSSRVYCVVMQYNFSILLEAVLLHYTISYNITICYTFLY